MVYRVIGISTTSRAALSKSYILTYLLSKGVYYVHILYNTGTPQSEKDVTSFFIPLPCSPFHRYPPPRKFPAPTDVGDPAR